MTRFDDILRSVSKNTIPKLLAEAGVDETFIRSHRSFTSQWSWDDGRVPVITLWREEMDNLEGAPSKTFADPSSRKDLVGSRRSNALANYKILVERSEQPLRVIVQTRHGSRKRGLDPEPWFSTVNGNAVIVQRGSAPANHKLSIDGLPMPERAPSFSLREARPHQIQFRDRVAAKTDGRCALTNAPPEVCEAAHFPWADWRKDNQAHHGVLLRRDLHAALDCGLISIDKSGVVVVSRYLAGYSAEYRGLHGRSVPV